MAGREGRQPAALRVRLGYRMAAGRADQLPGPLRGGTEADQQRSGDQRGAADPAPAVDHDVPAVRQRRGQRVDQRGRLDPVGYPEVADRERAELQARAGGRGRFAGQAQQPALGGRQQAGGA